jgi:hypothetical protein
MKFEDRSSWVKIKPQSDKKTVSSSTKDLTGVILVPRLDASNHYWVTRGPKCILMILGSIGEDQHAWVKVLYSPYPNLIDRVYSVNPIYFAIYTNIHAFLDSTVSNLNSGEKQEALEEYERIMETIDTKKQYRSYLDGRRFSEIWA